MHDKQSQTAGRDAVSVFSRFTTFDRNSHYQEVVCQEAARDALGRWPLLAELHGLQHPAERDAPHQA